MNNNDLKTFLSSLIELLTSSDFLDELLHNDLIVVVSLWRGYFDVIVWRKHNALNWSGSTCSRLKFFEFWLDLVDSISVVQSLQKALGESPLAASRWPIQKNVWEVFRLGQFTENVDLISMHGGCVLKLHGSILLNPEALFGAHFRF